MASEFAHEQLAEVNEFLDSLGEFHQDILERTDEAKREFRGRKRGN